MIRINLLPVRAARKKEFGRNQLIFLGLVVIGAGIGNFYWYDNRASEADRQKAQVASLNKEIKELDRIIGEVKNIAKEKQGLEDKLKILDKLKAGRTGPVKMLDAMTVAIPKNVWIKGLVEKGGALTLDGTAMSHDDLAEFMKGLQSVVWTPEGMGRLMETARAGATTSRVELTPSGQIKELSVDKVGFFFKDVQLKKATQRQADTKDKDTKVVDFQLALQATYAI